MDVDSTSKCGLRTSKTVALRHMDNSLAEIDDTIHGYTHTVANVATRPDQIGSWTVDTHDQMPSLRVHDNCFIDCQPSAQRSASRHRVDNLFWKVE
jgi:hypothetical protein